MGVDFDLDVLFTFSYSEEMIQKQTLLFEGIRLYIVPNFEYLLTRRLQQR